MNDALLSSKLMDWETPHDLFNDLDREFHFTLDPCCYHRTAKCKRHYTEEEDGLSQDWSHDVVWMNPPYGREMPKWIHKAYQESLKGATVVCLIPARTDTKIYHDIIQPHATIRFLKGRVSFLQDGVATNPAPFPSMIAIFRPPYETNEYPYQESVDAIALAPLAVPVVVVGFIVENAVILCKKAFAWHKGYMDEIDRILSEYNTKKK